MAQPKKRPFISVKGMETGRVTSAGKPVYKYKGEEISEKSIDIEADGKTYVIPTVIDGKLYTEEAAVAKFFNKEVEPIKVLKENIKERSKKLAEGGTAMKKQMELFEDGGLKDEGGMIDEVSGNDVPSGSTREEVRDDIPAQLSEGEFVFPADVVRYIGLEKLMMMRQEAKQGLKQMEAMGQMGNSDEATMPDDLPFDETDLDMEDELEYNEGGVVQAQQGTYVAPTVPTGNQPLGTTPMGAPPIPQQVGTGVSGTAFGTPYTPNVGKMYGAGATPYAPVTYTELLGPSAAGAPQTKNVRYVNEATNQTRMIPHLLNADGTIGDTLYPVPQGFVRKDEAPKEEAKKTQVQTAKVKPVESGDGAPSDDSKGGASISFGGVSDGKGKQVGGITANLSYNINPLGPMGVLGGLMTINNINQGKDVDTIGNKNGLTTNPVTMTVGKGKLSITSPEYSKVYNNPTGPEAKALADRLQALDNTAKNTYTYNPEKNVYTFTDALGNTDTIDADKANQIGKDVFEEIQQEVSRGKDATKALASRSSTQISMAQNYGIEAEDEQQTYGGYTGPTAGNLGSLSPNNDDEDNNDGFSDSPSDTNNDPGGFGDMSGMDFSTGGLAGKKKPKVKKMKRGGLASKK